MAHFIQNLMDQYGYYVLAVSLMLELLALPLPGEVLMTYAGLMIYQGHFNWIMSILTAALGASIGMTLSYWIGFKLGIPFFEKYGSKIHLGPDKLKKTSQWFERYGNKLLIIAYFIPGIRHFTGYFSGVTRMTYRTYMIYAYLGSLIWTSTFISLGKVLGPKWEQFHRAITKYLLIAGIIAVVVLVTVYVLKRYRSYLNDATINGLNSVIKAFGSTGKVKFLILTAFGVFLTFFIIMWGLVQDLLANEFIEFDMITSFIIHAIFNETWTVWMNRFAYLASMQVLLGTAALACIWIAFRGYDRALELWFLFIGLIGGELWDEGLRRLFHRTGPKNLIGTFPSEQTLITVIFLGLAVYLLVRHVNLAWLRTAAIILVLTVSFFVGISRIYFEIQYPSDVVAGYVFGGVWLSLIVVLLEIFRWLRSNRMSLQS
ncbi:bifunctional DedA family/phosphatase PAP2 family protein [Paenibacillus sp. NPDC056579]|uniref:bifunctional DedA family/phosphatase PAP2 family protein n=1 Tax=Paenibacillus sp. NPDC056579 TaxID=3345871 RepID=UPI0036B50973